MFQTVKTARLRTRQHPGSSDCLALHHHAFQDLHQCAVRQRTRMATGVLYSAAVLFSTGCIRYGLSASGTASCRRHVIYRAQVTTPHSVPDGIPLYMDTIREQCTLHRYLV